MLFLLFLPAMTIPQGNYSKEEIEVFKAIFNAHYENIRNFLYYKTSDMVLAEDIVQETFMKLWDIRATLQPETVKSLLYIMAANNLKSHLRHQKVVFNFVNTTTKEEIDHESADTAIRQKEMQEKLQRVLADMSEKNREVFLLSRMDNLTYADIADRLQLSVKAIEKRMHEALIFVRERITYKI